MLAGRRAQVLRGLSGFCSENKEEGVPLAWGGLAICLGPHRAPVRRPCRVWARVRGSVTQGARAAADGCGAEPRLPQGWGWECAGNPAARMVGRGPGKCFMGEGEGR